MPTCAVLRRAAFCQPSQRIASTFFAARERGNLFKRHPLGQYEIETVLSNRLLASVAVSIAVRTWGLVRSSARNPLGVSATASMHQPMSAYNPKRKLA